MPELCFQWKWIKLMLSNLIAFNWIGFSMYGTVHVNNSIRQLFCLIQQFSLYMLKITSGPLICTMNLNDRRRFFRCLHHSGLGCHLLNECQVENLKFISMGLLWNTNFIQFKTVTKTKPRSVHHTEWKPQSHIRNGTGADISGENCGFF